ncbi:LysE family translocator [Helicobacter sp. MIT 14-3879]|uniref:LysE family translocator n=1 Tax=Helicobacter sp. MIT 14-3879 TaxID=2040649 RepID=UPI000E1EC139|nr:LysE family translocator [Helicobacter sp. MIT 14-3879]RDU64684.1 LysE family translocator [Helicobacter sp. MIT 14-3879]
MIFIIAFLGAITPGPDIILVLRMALKDGFLNAFYTLCGIASGWIIFLTILYFGFAHIIKGDIAQIILGFCGGIYLIYLSYLLFSVKTNDIDLEGKKLKLDNKGKKNIYLKGLLVNLSNPKAIIFFSAIIAPYMDRSPIINLILLFCGLSSAFLMVIMIAIYFRGFITNKLFNIIDKVCSIVFLGFGIVLLIMAFKKIGIII